MVHGLENLGLNKTLVKKGLMSQNLNGIDMPVLKTGKS